MKFPFIIFCITSVFLLLSISSTHIPFVVLFCISGMYPRTIFFGSIMVLDIFWEEAVGKNAAYFSNADYGSNQ
ncbi:MAG: hypothetical protein ACQEQ4_03325 [Fibrobacterota bacterium]